MISPGLSITLDYAKVKQWDLSGKAMVKDPKSPPRRLTIH